MSHIVWTKSQPWGNKVSIQRKKSTRKLSKVNFWDFESHILTNKSQLKPPEELAHSSAFILSRGTQVKRKLRRRYVLFASHTWGASSAGPAPAVTQPLIKRKPFADPPITKPGFPIGHFQPSCYMIGWRCWWTCGGRAGSVWVGSR